MEAPALPRLVDGFLIDLETAPAEGCPSPNRSAGS